MNSPMPYQSLDENGCFIDVNPTWSEAMGYERDEIIGSRYEDLLHPDWKSLFKERFPEFKKNGYVHGVHFKIRRKDGQYIDILFEGKIGSKSDGTFKQTHCVFQDISLQKKAEENILKLSTAIEQSPTVIVITDTKGSVVNF